MSRQPRDDGPPAARDHGPPAAAPAPGSPESSAGAAEAEAGRIRSSVRPATGPVPLLRPIARPPSLPASIAVLDSTEHHAIGHCGSVCLYVWRKETRPDAMEAIFAAMGAATVAGGGLLGILGVVEPEASLPESAMRARLAAVLRDAAERMVASALTFEGSGFRAAAVRGAATSMALIARQPYPHRVFGSAETAAEWLVGRMGERGVACPDVERLVRAVRDLRGSPPR